MNNRKRVDPIPEEFASYEEAAEFWDTHDTTDYPKLFVPWRWLPGLEAVTTKLKLRQKKLSLTCCRLSICSKRASCFRAARLQ